MWKFEGTVKWCLRTPFQHLCSPDRPAQPKEVDSTCGPSMCSYFFIYTVQHVSIRFSVTLNQTYRCANTNDLKTDQKCNSRPQNTFCFLLCQLYFVYFVSIVWRRMQRDAEMASGAKSDSTRSAGRTFLNLYKSTIQNVQMYNSKRKRTFLNLFVQYGHCRKC